MAGPAITIWAEWHLEIVWSMSRSPVSHVAIDLLDDCPDAMIGGLKRRENVVSIHVFEYQDCLSYLLELLRNIKCVIPKRSTIIVKHRGENYGLLRVHY